MKVRVGDVQPGDIILGPSWGDPGRVLGRERSQMYPGEVHLRVQFQNGQTDRRRLPADALVDRLPARVSRPRFCPSCGSPLYGVNAAIVASLDAAAIFDVSCATCGWGGTIDSERHPQARRKRIYVAGPISDGGTLPAEQQEQNTRIAVDVADQLLVAGWAPFVPHLHLWWHGRHQHTHEEWLDFDFAWLSACDALIRVPGKSKGADAEVAWCRENGVPVYFTMEDAIAALKVEVGRDQATAL